MGCDVDQDKVSADQPNDDDGIEQVEANVGTTNRSMAAMSGAWLRRKVRHPWDGGPHRLTMYFVWTGRAVQAGCDDLEIIGLAHLYSAH